ncbi:MAG: C40 family peptidase [Spirochaetales bacterium]|nr:C40 family peptidase [Spirochaetales bacterium]
MVRLFRKEGAPGWVLILGAIPLLLLAEGPGESHEELREQIVADARELLGVPYRYGGTSRAGLDCSGLVRYVYNRAGFDLPVGARAQYEGLRPVKDPLPGDLLFFRIRSQRPDHVGLYTGDGRFIHAPVPGQRVRYETLSGEYWQKRLLGARSVLKE